MIYAIVQVQVEEFKPFWLYFQTRDFHIRQTYGALGSQLFRHQDDPSQVTILFQWESRGQMERFFQENATAWRANGARSVHPIGVSVNGNRAADTVPWCPPLFLQKAGELEA